MAAVTRQAEQLLASLPRTAPAALPADMDGERCRGWQCIAPTYADSTRVRADVAVPTPQEPAVTRKTSFTVSLPLHSHPRPLALPSYQPDM